jgi:hypothetical protein
MIIKNIIPLMKMQIFVFKNKIPSFALHKN